MIERVKLNYRITPARKKIIEIFSDKTNPLSAQKVSLLLTNKNIEVNKTTIYRELDFLLKNGFITELHINSGKKFYESSKLKHHHHLICNHCGVIEDITLKRDLAGEEKRLELEKRFKISNHSLEFFGLCANFQ